MEPTDLVDLVPEVQVAQPADLPALGASDVPALGAWLKVLGAWPNPTYPKQQQCQSPQSESRRPTQPALPRPPSIQLMTRPHLGPHPQWAGPHPQWAWQHTQWACPHPIHKGGPFGTWILKCPLPVARLWCSVVKAIQ